MSELGDGRQRQEEAARRRFDEQAAHRQENIQALSHSGGLAEVNTPEELARRLDRVTRYYAGDPLPSTTEAAPGVASDAAKFAAEVVPGVEPATGAEQETSAARAGIVLEKIINTADFVGVRYLEGGVAASRAVSRVVIRDEAGRVVGYGTGSMVSPRLLLTNHHVLPTDEAARFSAAEFNYQDGLDGTPLLPQQLPLDPDTFFINDPERDFALVAVAARDADLAAYGLNRLIEAQGKAIVGDFVTIVQHPGGEKKQVALRDNRIVDQLEFFLHYEADTEPGSSGSPVFNDQWEVVALHHASVPTPEHGQGTFLNEGIRASRILHYLSEQQFAGAQQTLLDQLRAPERITVGTSPTRPAAQGAPALGADLAGPISVASDGQALVWAVPLELTIALRNPATSQAAPQAQAVGPTQGATSVDAAAAQPPGAGVTTEALVEPFRDEDFSRRRGYDDHFLGIEVPLPTVVDESVVSRLEDGSHVAAVRALLDRHAQAATARVVHRLQRRRDPRAKGQSPAGTTAGAASAGLGPHDQEKWFTDPRIPRSTAADRFFTKDRASFDKGHIVSRDDVAWGDSFDELRRANGDTFHVTNCSPQVARLQPLQPAGRLGRAREPRPQASRHRALLRLRRPAVPRRRPASSSGVDDDRDRDIAIPRQFWKIVVARRDNALQTFAFLLDQDLSDTKFEFAVDKEWRTRMISLAELEQLVGAAHSLSRCTTPTSSTPQAARRSEPRQASKRSPASHVVAERRGGP